MPYRLTWEPNPTDFSLEVFEELPEGFLGVGLFLFGGPVIYRNSTGEVMYHCRHCHGYIKAEPLEESINTMEPQYLSGRNGRAWYCRRCGEEIAFSGAYS